jgi:FtsH-binding integral membrane protein
MSYADNPYRSPMDAFAISAAEDERAGFITKTYLHLAGAIGLFVVLEAVLLNLPGVEGVIRQVFSVRFGWIALMVGFMLVSYIADRWARTATSPAMQYAGLGLYVVAEAVIFVPLLWIADNFYPGVIMSAAVATLSLFGLLTVVVFITRKDFSFLRSVLIFGGFAALGLIVAAVLFQFALGPVFTYAMIALACGYILYDTSNILHRYRIGQHVGAALALFASVMLLFWYILRLFMSRRD